jgi:hypothetical protein
MALPLYKHPVYVLRLPSTDKEVKYRPFLVKDEKNLLLAQQSEDETTMIETLKNVIASCIITKDVDVDEMPIFDLEYIFTQLRAKSVGENIELIFTCRTKDCGEKTKVSFKIDPKLFKDESHTNKIELFNDVGIVMKYANVSMIKDINKMNLDDPDQILNLIIRSIDYIFDADSVYHTKDQSEKDLKQFVESLPREASEKIKNFFLTTPRLQQKVEYTCPKCSTKNEYTAEGIESFF